MKEKAMKVVFLIAACVSILAVALICIFLFANGIPAIKEIGLFDFLTGTAWKPGNHKFGILPMILGSIYVTAGVLSKILSEKMVSNLKRWRRFACRNPIRCLRIFWTCCSGSDGARHLWRKWKQYFNGISFAWHYDSANDY